MTDLEQITSRLDRLTELVEDNSKKLHQLHRSMVMGRIWRVFYWAVIIGLAIGSFYFLQPYIDTVFDAYTQVNDIRSDLQAFPSSF